MRRYLSPTMLILLGALLVAIGALLVIGGLLGARSRDRAQPVPSPVSMSSPETSPPPSPYSSGSTRIRVPYGGTQTTPEGFSIQFVAVDKDGRCPRLVECAVAGYAQIRVVIREGGKDVKVAERALTISGPAKQQDAPPSSANMVILRDTAIVFVQLEPIPERDYSAVQDPNAYVAHFIILPADKARALEKRAAEPKILFIARNHAQSLGYDVATMQFQLTDNPNDLRHVQAIDPAKYQSHWFVYGSPAEPQEGGDLWIVMEKGTYKVIQVIRGQ